MTSTRRIRRGEILYHIEDNCQVFIAFTGRFSTDLHRISNRIILWGQRGVAQFGSAPRLGRGGQRFKSAHPDLGNVKRE
jgi:hypothetical protein